MIASKGLPVYQSETLTWGEVSGEELIANFPNMTGDNPAFKPTFIENTTFIDYYD